MNVFRFFCSKVEAMKQSYFELRPVKPRLKRLRERLEENVYDGNILDNAHQEKHKAIYQCYKLARFIQYIFDQEFYLSIYL